MRRLFALLLVVLLLAACGGDDAVQETGASTSVAPTTTVAAQTTTTAAPTTTVAEEEPWVDGSTVLRAGDCFIEVEGDDDDSIDREVVPCDTSHFGEVIATGSACPAGIEATEFGALASDYVGVAEADVFDWLEGEGVVGRAMVRFDDAGHLAGTACYLEAAEGSLTGSYRATSE